jgi:hypothetical protein
MTNGNQKKGYAEVSLGKFSAAFLIQSMAAIVQSELRL